MKRSEINNIMLGADEFIQKSIERDPDLWVVEIETRDGTIPVDGL